MDHYAPLPTPEQLAMIGRDLGLALTHDHRIQGGLGCTMDVLLARGGDEQMILRRYWPEVPEELVDPAVGEAVALQLAADHGIPAPDLLWIDRRGLFPERAIIISYIDGVVELDPSEPLEWAEQLASVLVDIHAITPPSEHLHLFPPEGEDPSHLPDEDRVRRHPLGSRLWERREDLARSREEVQPTYVFHDFWPGNVLWREGRLVAVVDWEGGAMGDPALDVAYCFADIMFLGLQDPASRFLDQYRSLSRRPLPNFDFWYLTALCRPMPDIALWVPSWQTMGVPMTEQLARDRHRALIEEALRR